MRLKRTIGLLAVSLTIAAAFVTTPAQTSGYRISAPHTYKNLSIFLIHGRDETKKTMMTLQEAMERKLFVVYETSNVNELEVENLSKELDVFIQSGDIVKGGKQDRVLAVSIIIPARSGRVKIEAFCVESGRWQKRGNEESGKFSSSDDRIVTKELKVAANAARSQQEVWAQVSDAQERLAKGVGGDVKAGPSQSSLQLSLENEKVVATVDEYIKALARIIDGRTDVIGYAVAINGKVNSADVYASNALFKKLWPRMLKASATEAVAESRSVRLAEPVRPTAISEFISDSEKAKREERSTKSGSRVVTRQDKYNVMFESVDEKGNVTVHRSYVKKH